jgi:hypothetical protein
MGIEQQVTLLAISKRRTLAYIEYSHMRVSLLYAYRVAVERLEKGFAQSLNTLIHLLI